MENTVGLNPGLYSGPVTTDSGDALGLEIRILLPAKRRPVENLQVRDQSPTHSQETPYGHLRRLCGIVIEE